MVSPDWWCPPIGAIASSGRQKVRKCTLDNPGEKAGNAGLFRRQGPDLRRYGTTVS